VPLSERVGVVEIISPGTSSDYIVSSRVVEAGGHMYVPNLPLTPSPNPWISVIFPTRQGFPSQAEILVSIDARELD